MNPLSKRPMRVISPSLLSADFAQLGAEIKRIEHAGATRLHLDVMDGHFVPNLTFGPLLVEAINRLTDLHLEAHLMIEEPRRYLEQFVKAGADTVIVHHLASRQLRADLAAIRSLGAKAGVALNPNQDFSVVLPFLNDMDYILIMSVNPGFGGQEFIESALETMSEAVAARLPASGGGQAPSARLRRSSAQGSGQGPQTRPGPHHDYLIAVDGGVNLENVERVFATGVDIAVVGSALFRAPDFARRFKELRA